MLSNQALRQPKYVVCLKKTFKARADTKSPQPLKEYLAGLDSTTTAAYLGIAGQLVNLTERIIGVNKLQKKTGVYIFEKVADANVSNNELRTIDIIVDFDGKPVGSVDDLHRLLKQEMIGIRKHILSINC